MAGRSETIKRAVSEWHWQDAILGGKYHLKNQLEDGSITILQPISDSITTYVVNLKVRCEEPNIETFSGFIQGVW